MFKRVISVLLFIGLIISSCATDDESYGLDDPTQKFNDTYKLISEKAEIDESYITGPTQILVVDSLLIVNDHFEDQGETYFFGLFDKKSGELYRRFGREGRGPDEFLDNSFLFHTSTESGNVIANNRRLFSITEISLEKVLEDSGTFTVDQVDGLNNRYSMVSKISDNLFFGTGTFENGRFALSDTSGTLINTSINYPFEDEFDDISTRDLGMAYQSSFSFHPTEPLVAVAIFTAANLDILRVENDNIQEISQVHSYPPKFENQSSETQISVMFDAENRMGYWDIDVTEEYIYTLYSGRERTDPNQSTGNKVFVFDWEGNPIKQLNLDVEVSRIAVDQNNETLYAVANDDNNEALIVSFSLD